MFAACTYDTGKGRQAGSQCDSHRVYNTVCLILFVHHIIVVGVGESKRETSTIIENGKIKRTNPNTIDIIVVYKKRIREKNQFIIC